MYRQSPSRSSQRSKRIKVKHVLQFALLLGVGCWLLYQLKHSHDKNIELEKNEAKGIPESLHGIELPKLGRKGIQDIPEETLSRNAKYQGLVNEEEDEQENKIEESESKSETLSKAEYGGEGDGVDELEENDQEGTDADYEELPGDEKDKEVDDENEADADESARDKTGAGSSAEETDQEGDNVSIPEARETQYNADDASSAVAHDSQIRNFENAEGQFDQFKTHNNSLEATKNDTRKDLEVVVDEVAGEHLLNVVNESGGGITESSANGSSGNSTTEIATESKSLSLNSTVHEDNAEAVPPGIKSENGSILSAVTSDQLDTSNPPNSANKTTDAELPNEPASEENMVRSGASGDAEVDSIDGSSIKLESTSNYELQEILREAVDTLPDIQNNGAEGAAAE